ncbi:MAG: hypothetical protein ACLPID_09005 [Beijerinckiaceae bacterium]
MYERAQKLSCRGRLVCRRFVLVVHAIGAGRLCGVELALFARFAFTSRLATAASFLAIVIALDVFVVALLIERSFAMFENVLGTWLPFALIFAATWTVGIAFGGTGQVG